MTAIELIDLIEAERGAIPVWPACRSCQRRRGARGTDGDHCRGVRHGSDTGATGSLPAGGQGEVLAESRS